MTGSTTHTWKFFRTGGLDQVSLETGADLLNLDQLDQKLWVALSCPVKGLELDEHTLKLIDTDKDGRIRVPELLAAIKWAGAQVKDAGVFLQGVDGLPLAAINDATPEGKILLTSARQILVSLGKSESNVITVEDATNTAGVFAANPLNGSGVVPAEATDNAEVQALIKDILDTVGGELGRSGATGVTAAKVDAFFGELDGYVNWLTQSAKKDIAILGDKTDGALAAIKAVRSKVDDFFARCRLAAYDPRSIASLNRQESEYLDIAAKDLKISAEELAAFPLALVSGSNAVLPLLQGVNPAYAGVLAALQSAAVGPVFGAEKVSLTEKEWQDLNARFAAYETWLGSKTGSSVEKLGLARAREILASKARAALTDLLARDQSLAPQFSAISDVERLTRFFRDLRTLVHNFVNFADFYSKDRWATFQSGVLYLDSRSTEYCVRVDNAGAHATLAAMSKSYIAYVDCKRTGGETMTVAASFTQGDGDYLFIGRNGIFYDRKGRDWDATIVKIIDNPVSLRQAFWSPYKKFVRMIDEQVAKRAAAADAAATGKLSAAAANTANADKTLATPPPAGAPKKVDVGTVAALGVAVGAIGGALATVSAKLVELVWWQIPLIFVALMLIISLPSVIIAWLKLRQRTVGPILDANGWAINGRVKINIPFGTKLTAKAELPEGAKRVLGDPYAEKSGGKKFVLFLIIVLALAAAWVRWDFKKNGHYFWQDAPVVVPTAPVTAPATAAATP